MSEKHTHKLKRLKYKSGNTIFFCALPDCLFKTNIALALGKKSICWRCGNEFIMSEYDLRLAKPHCPACHKGKNIKGVVFQEVREAAENISPLSLSDELEQIIKQAQPEEEEI